MHSLSQVSMGSSNASIVGQLTHPDLVRANRAVTDVSSEARSDKFSSAKKLTHQEIMKANAIEESVDEEIDLGSLDQDSVGLQNL